MVTNPAVIFRALFFFTLCACVRMCQVLGLSDVRAVRRGPLQPGQRRGGVRGLRCGGLSAAFGGGLLRRLREWHLQRRGGQPGTVPLGVRDAQTTGPLLLCGKEKQRLWALRSRNNFLASLATRRTSVLRWAAHTAAVAVYFCVIVLFSLVFFFFFFCSSSFLLHRLQFCSDCGVGYDSAASASACSLAADNFYLATVKKGKNDDTVYVATVLCWQCRHA